MDKRTKKSAGRRTKIATISSAILLLLLVLEFVVAIPPIPESYSGYAIFNGSPPPINTSITVEINGTGVSVGNTTTYNDNGRYFLQIYFDCNETNETEGGATEGDLLLWKINGTTCDTPQAGNDTANSGELNMGYTIAVGKIPILVVDGDPSNLTTTLNEGNNKHFTAYVVSPPGTNLSYSWKVDGVTNSTETSFTYYSSIGESGSRLIEVNATNGTSSDTRIWNLTINQLPVITPTVPNITLKSNTIKDFNLTPYESDFDSNNGNLTWSLSGDNNLIATTYVDPETDILTVIPRPDVSAIDYITLTLTDEHGANDTQEIAIIIEPRCIGVDAPVSGNWTIYLNTTCNDTLINLSTRSDINVLENKTLKLENTTVNVENSTITLGKNSIFDITNSVVNWLS